VAEAPAIHSVPHGRFVSALAFVAALTRTPAALALWSFELSLALAPALMHEAWLRDVLAGKHAMREEFANFDAIARFDLRAPLALLDSSTAQLGAVLALLAMIGGCFAAGGWCQCFLEPPWEPTLRTFARGGARFFARNLRVLVLTLVVLGGLGWVCYGWPWTKLVLGTAFHVPASDVDRLETLHTEDLALGLRIAQQLLFGLGFGLILTWGDYLRTSLARSDRRGVIGEALDVFGKLVRHPVRLLRPMLALFLFEALAVTTGGLIVQHWQSSLEDVPRLRTVALMAALAASVLFVRCLVRGARYHAALRILRELEHSALSA
jgi:hypothetical protein